MSDTTVVDDVQRVIARMYAACDKPTTLGEIITDLTAIITRIDEGDDPSTPTEQLSLIRDVMHSAREMVYRRQSAVN